MAEAKITALTELAETPAGDDVIAIVDISAGPATTKKIKVSNLVASGTSLVSHNQVVGTTANPTRNIATFVLLDEMTVSFTPAEATNLIFIKFNGEFEGIGKEEAVTVAVFVDTVEESSTQRSQDDKLGRPMSISLEKHITLSAAAHTIEIRWKTDAADLGATAVGVQRIMIVEEWDM